MTTRRVVILAVVVLAIGGTVGLIVAGGIVRAARIQRRVDQALAKIRSDGDPVLPTDLVQPPIPDDENAAVVYRKAFGAMQLTASDDDLMGKLRAGRTSLDEPNVAAQARAIVQRNAEALRLIRQATRMPKCDFRVDWSRDPLDVKLPHLARLRKCSRLLALETALLTRETAFDQALASYCTNLSLSNSLQEPPMRAFLTLCSVVVIADGSVRDLLAEAQPSPQDCRAAAAAAALVDLRGSYTRGLKAERALGIWIFNHVRDSRDPVKAIESLSTSGDEGSARGHASSTQVSPVDTGVRRAATAHLLAGDELFYLKAMEKRIKDSQRHYRIAKDAPDVAEVAERESRAGRLRVISAILLPIYGSTLQRRDFTQSLLDLDRIALLLKAYRADHGAYPASLAELAKAEKTALPDDPFSGKPYTYRREGEGFLLYSWGPDLDDDSGAPLVSTSSRGYEDIVLRCSL